MQYEEEPYARALYQQLMQHLEGEDTQTEITVAGAGVLGNEWECTAQHGLNQCTTDCCGGNTLEYWTSFKHGSEEIAFGRTRSQALTVNAVKEWLNAGDIARLYKRFPFVDRRKRALIRVCEDLLRCAPRLANPPAQILPPVHGDWSDLVFRQGNRSVEVFIYEKSKRLGAAFFWNECLLFELQPKETETLANVIWQWVVEQAMPSQMRTLFPWLKITEAADYFERGEPIIGKFLESWDNVEEICGGKRSIHTISPAARRFIAQLRARGYDKLLFAQSAVQSLYLFRSQPTAMHIPHAPHAYIAFNFRSEGVAIHFNILSDTNAYHSYASLELTPPIELTPEIEALLDQLVAIEID